MDDAGVKIQRAARLTVERSHARGARSDGLIERSSELHERSVALRQRLGRLEWPEVRVLNLEDHAPARFLRTRTLENAGYVVQEVGSVEEARAFAAGDPPIRLALLDVGLPDGDGFEVCEHFKFHSPQTRVAIVTSIYRSGSSRQQGIGVGADEYLLEPLPGHRLLRTAERLLTASPSELEPAVITTDGCGLILGLNAPAGRLLNLSARGAIGRSLLPFIGADRDRITKDLHLAAAGQYVQGEMIFRPRERKPVTVEVDLDGGDHTSPTVEWTLRHV